MAEDKKNLTPEGNEIGVEKKGFFKKATAKAKELGGKAKKFAVDHRGTIGTVAGVAAGVAGAVVYGIVTSGQKTEAVGIPEQPTPEEEEPVQNFEDPQVETETATE